MRNVVEELQLLSLSRESLGLLAVVDSVVVGNVIGMLVPRGVHCT
jgi:hypothetical protein